MIPDHTDGYYKSLYQQMVQAFFMSSVSIFPVRDRLHQDPATGAW